MSDLTQKKCVPCEGGIPSLERAKIEELIKEVPGWEIVELDGYVQIVRIFSFKNFKAALRFVNQVGDLAETESHHPDIFLYSWNKVRLSLYTHAISGLHENDFIMAAKINGLV